MKLKITGLDKKLAYKLGEYEVEVGLLENKARRKPKFGEYKSYAGKTLLKEGQISEGISNVEVAQILDKKYKWLRDPFLRKTNAEVVLVLNDIVRDINGKGDKQRILNGFQAVVRNPILRGEYGKNTGKWANKKGFDDLMFMTGQFFKAIKARFVKDV